MSVCYLYQIFISEINLCIIDDYIFRLVHGSVKHSLSWTIVTEHVQFDPVLVTLAEVSVVTTFTNNLK